MVRLYGSKEKALEVLTRQRDAVRRNGEVSDTKLTDKLIKELTPHTPTNKEAQAMMDFGEPDEQDLFTLAECRKSAYNRGKQLELLRGEPEDGPDNKARYDEALSDIERKFALPASSGKLRVVQEFINRLKRTTGYVDLNGQEADTPIKVATLAKIWRDERFETFRIIYTNDEF